MFVVLGGCRTQHHGNGDDVASLVPISSCKVNAQPDEGISEGNWDLADVPSALNSLGQEQRALYSQLRRFSSKLDLPVPREVLGLLRLAKGGFDFGIRDSVSKTIWRKHTKTCHACVQIF